MSLSLVVDATTRTRKTIWAYREVGHCIVIQDMKFMCLLVALRITQTPGIHILADIWRVKT